MELLALTEAPEMALNPVSGKSGRGLGMGSWVGEKRRELEGETKRSDGVGERKRAEDLT